MSMPRQPVTTMKCVDDYCALYQDVFPDVRSFELFKLLHVGLIAEIPRKSLPAIAKTVGLPNGQSLHHFLAVSPWRVEAFRQRRLSILRRVLHERPFVLCIDETGDKKKGHTTDYVARQYLGRLGKIDAGLVSVNAYGVLEGITFPLMFEVFKPRPSLKATDGYQTKPQLALQLLRELKTRGFPFQLVVADSLYGESSEFLEGLLELDLTFVVAMRANHGVWLGPGQRVRYTSWKPFERRFADGRRDIRYICEIVFGQRRDIRYYQITTDPATLPEGSTCFVMTNLTQASVPEVANLYGMRMWIEYGFKQSKQELGWSDFRVTSYPAIEKWWEMVSSAYLMVSLQAEGVSGQPQASTPPEEVEQETLTTSQERLGVEGGADLQEARGHVLRQHQWWNEGKGWKHVLHNLRLILQPFIICCSLSPGFEILHLPSLKRGLGQLLTLMQSIHGLAPI
jgi:SRSO17 transposase